MTVLLQVGTPVLTTVARLAGVAAFAGLISLVVSAIYRWYVREAVPTGLSTLVALSGVAVVLNTTTLLATEIAAGLPAFEILDAAFNLVALGSAGLLSLAGTRLGDRLGTDLFAAGSTAGVDADVSEIARTVGRVTAVELPDEIAAVEGHDPVPAETTETLSGRTFLFPRRLSQAELRDRLVARLKADYGVGVVELTLADDGTVTDLAIGSRAAGLSPRLPPGTTAVAIRADPAHAARAGDLVQVWEPASSERVLTGELRGVSGDVATVAVDAADAAVLDGATRYRLVTLPVQVRPDREFATLLRSADETLATVTVSADSDLAGDRIGALGLSVVAVVDPDGGPDPLPSADRVLEPGDVLYAVGSPDALARLTASAG